jgi:hypothetical protein
VIGGGFSGRRVGELAIGRASVILKAEKIKLDIAIIRNNPDEAGLLGAMTGPILDLPMSARGTSRTYPTKSHTDGKHSGNPL